MSNSDREGKVLKTRFLPSLAREGKVLNLPCLPGREKSLNSGSLPGREFSYLLRKEGSLRPASRRLPPSLRSKKLPAMQPPIKATLPYPPTVNHYWLVGKRTVRISDAGREYRRRVVAILSGVPTIAGPVAVRVDVYPPDRRKRDLDNIAKGLLDAMAHAGVYADDSQVVDLHIIRRDARPPGHVEVTIAEAPA